MNDNLANPIPSARKKAIILLLVGAVVIIIAAMLFPDVVHPPAENPGTATTLDGTNLPDGTVGNKLPDSNN